MHFLISEFRLNLKTGMEHQMQEASKPYTVVERSDTTGLKTNIRRIPEGMPACARVCPPPVSRNGDRLGLPFGWHPFGMRTRGREGTGGVAPLNHLTAENPPGSGNASYQLSMITGVPPPRRGRPLAAHGNAVGLIRFKTLSPARAPHEDATLSEGPGILALLRGLASKNGYFRALLNRKCLILNSQFFQSACSADLPPCGAFSHSGFIRNVPPL